MKLYIKKLRENALVPKRETAGSAGMDLCACLTEDIIIPSGEIVKIPTGIAAAPESDEAVLLIYARSGLASKNGITLANCVGVVDSDYRGEICIPLINLGKDDFTVTPNMRIAQMVLSPVFFPEITETDELGETLRGGNGFGSTGI